MRCRLFIRPTSAAQSITTKCAICSFSHTWDGNSNQPIQTNLVFICPASLDGGYSGFLTYAQNNLINASDFTTIMSLKNIPHPSLTVMFGETDGYDACMYSDTDPYGGNVCYRHQGGNEHSVYSTVTVEGGVAGQKPKFGRANLVFLDSHTELRKNAPQSMFDPNAPLGASSP